MDDRIIVHPPAKDAKGLYYVTVSYYIDGVRKQKRKSGFKKSSDAKKTGEAIRKKLEEDLPVIKIIGEERITLKKFAEDYAEVRSDWANRTKIERMRAITHCDFADKSMVDVTLMDIEKNIVRLNKIYKFNTVKSIHAGWNVFFNAAVKYKHILVNPNTMMLQAPKTKKEVKAMTIKAAKDLAKQIEDENIRLFTNIGFRCGLRRGEILDLNIKDFDMQKKTVSVSHQFSNTKNGWTRNAPLKTQNSYRVVPVPDELLKIIANRKLIGINGEIFTGSLNGLAVRTLKFYKKLGYDTTIHALRHTYITNLILSNQFDIQSVASLAGDTVNTILSTYSHYLEQKQEENAIKINKLFG